jgi:hypothetical protein
LVEEGLSLEEEPKDTLSRRTLFFKGRIRDELKEKLRSLSREISFFIDREKG